MNTITRGQFDCGVSALRMTNGAYSEAKHERAIANVNVMLEAMEIEVSPKSEACNKTLLDLNLPIGVIIGGISRNGSTFVPDGSTVVRGGDHIIFFSLPRDIEESVALFTS